MFRALPVDWVDRRTLQEVLGVSKTVAWRLLRHCGASGGPGNTLVCPRGDLIAALERLQLTGEYEHEIRRRDRLESQLGDLLKVARSRHIEVAPEDQESALLNSRFENLPVGIELTPGRLMIEFAGIEEFLQKVGRVVFALQNDYESISDFLETRRTDSP